MRDFENGHFAGRGVECVVARTSDPPVVLIKWYDFTKWLLDRIDGFPKNQRFIFGQRLADHALDVMELLVEAAYRSRKAELLSAANRKLEMLRWLVRLTWDRNLLSGKQYEFCCRGLTEYGRMVGGWLKQATDKEARGSAPS